MSGSRYSQHWADGAASICPMPAESKDGPSNIPPPSIAETSFDTSQSLRDCPAITVSAMTDLSGAGLRARH